MSAYVEVFSSPNDLRFGNYAILRQEDKPDNHLIRKTYVFTEQPDFDSTLARLETRAALQAPNLLTLMQVTPDHDSLTVRAYFEFPPTTFDIKSLQKGAFIQFCEDILGGLASLESLGQSHGNVRPEFFTWMQASQRFKLIENLVDFAPPWEVQRLNMQHKQPLFLSPNYFENLARNCPRFAFNGHKNDVFALGLVLLMKFVEIEQIQAVYDVDDQRFDFGKFEELLRGCHEIVRDPQFDSVLAFVWNSLLRVNETERLGPGEAYAEFQKVRSRIEGRVLRTLKTPQDAPLDPQVVAALGGPGRIDCKFYDPFEFVDHERVTQEIFEKKDPATQRFAIRFADDDPDFLQKRTSPPAIAGPSVDLEKFLVTPHEDIQELRKQSVEKQWPNLSGNNGVSVACQPTDPNAVLPSGYSAITDSELTSMGLNIPPPDMPHLDMTLPLHDGSVVDQSSGQISDHLEHSELENSLNYLKSSGFHLGQNLEAEKEETKQIVEKATCLLFSEAEMESKPPERMTESNHQLKLSDFLNGLKKRKLELVCSNPTISGPDATLQSLEQGGAGTARSPMFPRGEVQSQPITANNSPHKAQIASPSVAHNLHEDDFFFFQPSKSVQPDDFFNVKLPTPKLASMPNHLASPPAKGQTSVPGMPRPPPTSMVSDLRIDEPGGSGSNTLLETGRQQLFPMTSLTLSNEKAKANQKDLVSYNIVTQVVNRDRTPDSILPAANTCKLPTGPHPPAFNRPLPINISTKEHPGFTRAQTNIYPQPVRSPQNFSAYCSPLKGIKRGEGSRSLQRFKFSGSRGDNTRQNSVSKKFDYARALAEHRKANQDCRGLPSTSGNTTLRGKDTDVMPFPNTYSGKFPEIYHGDYHDRQHTDSDQLTNKASLPGVFDTHTPKVGEVFAMKAASSLCKTGPQFASFGNRPGLGSTHNFKETWLEKQICFKKKREQHYNSVAKFGGPQPRKRLLQHNGESTAKLNQSLSNRNDSFDLKCGLLPGHRPQQREEFFVTEMSNSAVVNHLKQGLASTHSIASELKGFRPPQADDERPYPLEIPNPEIKRSETSSNQFVVQKGPFEAFGGQANLAERVSKQSTSKKRTLQRFNRSPESAWKGLHQTKEKLPARALGASPVPNHTASKQLSYGMPTEVVTRFGASGSCSRPRNGPFQSQNKHSFSGQSIAKLQNRVTQNLGGRQKFGSQKPKDRKKRDKTESSNKISNLILNIYYDTRQKDSHSSDHQADSHEGLAPNDHTAAPKPQEDPRDAKRCGKPPLPQPSKLHSRKRVDSECVYNKVVNQVDIRNTIFNFITSGRR